MPRTEPDALSPLRRARGRTNQRNGADAESRAAHALEHDGWQILARRKRTAAGEIDLVARKQGHGVPPLLAFIEVKRSAQLAEAAAMLGARQKARLLAAAEILLAEHPDWQGDQIRFDVLLVDTGGRIRRIADAFRIEN
jgi:putative endonuclease